MRKDRVLVTRLVLRLIRYLTTVRTVALSPMLAFVIEGLSIGLPNRLGKGRDCSQCSQWCTRCGFTAPHREIFWETHENFSETAPNQWCTSVAPYHSLQFVKISISHLSRAKELPNIRTSLELASALSLFDANG